MKLNISLLCERRKMLCYSWHRRRQARAGGGGSGECSGTVPGRRACASRIVFAAFCSFCALKVVKGLCNKHKLFSIEIQRPLKSQVVTALSHAGVKTIALLAVPPSGGMELVGGQI